MNLRKVASFAIGPLGNAALGLIQIPLLTWYFSAEDVGRLAMLQVATNACVLIFSLGLDQAYVREFHEAADKPGLLRLTAAPGLALLFLSLLLLSLRPQLLSELLFARGSAAISLLVGLCLIAALLSRFLALVLRMEENGLALSMVQVLPKALFLLVLGVFTAQKAAFDFTHMLLAQASSVVTVTLAYSWITRRSWFTATPSQFDTARLRELLAFGLPLVVGSAAFWGLTAMDRVFLREYSSFEELGIYSVSSSFAAAALIFQAVFSTVWAPTVYKWAAEGLKVEKVDQANRYVLVAVVVLFSLAGTLSWVAGLILPPAYGKVQYVLVPCMAYPLLYTLSETTVVGLGIMKRSKLAMLASLIAVATNAALCFALVPRYGAAGAATATAVAFWVFLVCRTEFSCLVWRPVPRLGLYASTLTCVALSVGTALWAGRGGLMSGAWLVALLLFLGLFHETVRDGLQQLARQVQEARAR